MLSVLELFNSTEEFNDFIKNKIICSNIGKKLLKGLIQIHYKVMV